MDSAEAMGSTQFALLVDLGLLALFAVQHSVMARPAFKRVITRILPATIERSTYVLASSAALLFLFWQWKPLGGIVWSVQGIREDWRYTLVLHWAGFWFWPPRSRSVTLTSSAFGRSGVISWGSPRPTRDLRHPFSIALFDIRYTSGGFSRSGARPR